MSIEESIPTAVHETTRRPISSWKAFTRGLAKASRHLRLAAFMWLVNLAFALPLALAFRSVVREAIGNSTYGRTLREGLDLLWLTDLLRERQSALDAVGEAAGWLSLLYVVIASLVAAGAIATLDQELSGFRFRAFFAGVARLGGRYLRLLAVTLAALFILLLFVTGPVSTAVGQVFGRGEDEMPLFWATGALYALSVVVAALLFAISDYTKVRLAVGVERSVVREVGRTLAFLFAYRPGALVAFALCESVSLAVLGVSAVVSSWVVPNGLWEVALLALVQQLIMLARMWVRLVFWSTELEIVRGNT
jgi:hypothetical protein